MPSIHIKGELEIDKDRGVIYFHSDEHCRTILRICNLPKPIPNEVIEEGMDITHLHNASWRGYIAFNPKAKGY